MKLPDGLRVCAPAPRKADHRWGRYRTQFFRLWAPVYKYLGGDTNLCMVSRLCLLLLALFVSTPAQATAWLRGESEQFVVHARIEEAELRALIQDMEDFARALEHILPGETQPGRKLEFYLTSERWRLARVIDFDLVAVCEDQADNAISYVWRPNPPRLLRDGSIYYCIAKHHLNNAFFRPMPDWVQQGVPQFFSTAVRDKDGAFVFGSPDPYRPVRGKIDAKAIARVVTAEADDASIEKYRRWFTLSRVIANPFLIDPARAGVLDRYIAAYASGRSLSDIAVMLGDTEALARQIDRGLDAKRATLRRVALQPGRSAVISVTAVRPDEVALFDLRLARIFDEARSETAANLEALTDAYPESAPVWYEYAAAEHARVQNGDEGTKPVLRGFGFATGDIIVTGRRHPDTEAWRAVNRALELDPDHASAQRLKAEIMLDRLVRAENEPAAEEWEEVRASLEPLAEDPRANPLAAALSYQSWIEQGLPAPDAAFDRLGRAFNANAGVADIRYAYAVALAGLGRSDKSRMLLRSMLHHPQFAEAAIRALEEAP